MSLSIYVYAYSPALCSYKFEKVYNSFGAYLCFSWVTVCTSPFEIYWDISLVRGLETKRVNDMIKYVKKLQNTL